MKIGFMRIPVLCAIALVVFTVAAGVASNDKPVKPAILQGKVQMIDPESSTITVDTKNGTRRLVVYGPDTKLKYGRSKGRDSSWDQVHEANYISCSGTWDEKERLHASECVHRESR
jgi:hypothetical protein